MNLWQYYDGDLKYFNMFDYSYEKEIAKTNPKWAYEFVKKYGKDEDLEPAIAKNAEYSFWYADEILNGPFKLGEPIIAKDEYYSKEYTQEVLKKDFYLDGKLICKYEG